ncbi:reverse transcriptase [Gossypium australe]|uniref:Reverse transcriptase n=1 Tax=Gossypium australe TaxID=47621 RepID=A0A5B6VZP0_9ROSI|nr:reverse transcriptase [Gossypium australe]
MVFFMETKIDVKRMEEIRRMCGFVNGIDVGAEGSRGGLCLAWKEESMVSLKTFLKNHIDVLIEGSTVNGVWRFTGFYGSSYARRWDKNRYLWLVCGDFNEIMYSFEKIRGILRKERKMAAFCEVLDECQLMDMGFQGAWFTWEGERLDRGVANENWMHLFPKGTVRHLTHSISDHCPLLILTANSENFIRKPRFRFEAWWTLEESFEQEVRKS